MRQLHVFNIRRWSWEITIHNLISLTTFVLAYTQYFVAKNTKKNWGTCCKLSQLCLSVLIFEIWSSLIHNDRSFYRLYFSRDVGSRCVNGNIHIDLVFDNFWFVDDTSSSIVSYRDIWIIIDLLVIAVKRFAIFIVICLTLRTIPICELRATRIIFVVLK